MLILKHWLIYLAAAGPVPATALPADSVAMPLAGTGAVACGIAAAPQDPSRGEQRAADMPARPASPAAE